MKKLSIVLIMCLLITGCATELKLQNLLSTWDGNHVDNLITQWGKPQKEYKKVNGGKILEYLYHNNAFLPGESSKIGTVNIDQPNVLDRTPMSLICRVTFNISKNGYIERWQYSGNNCISNYDGAGKLKKNGVGSFTWLNGATYSGEWLNSKPDGQGEMVYSNGEKYTGEFKDGIIHGKGAYSFPDGQRHVGGFKDGLIHGPGIQTTPDGKTLIGIWENGKLQKEN
jgi:hypothetical protein